MGDVLKSVYLRNKAVEYLQRFIGLPYLWGGDDPMSGFDCSGLIVEILQAVGILPHGSDFTADALYEKFQTKAIDRGYAACLVSGYSGDRVIRDDRMPDPYNPVGPSGGGSTTTDL